MCVRCVCACVVAVLAVVVSAGGRFRLNCSSDPDFEMTFDPSELRVKERTRHRLQLTVTPPWNDTCHVAVTSSDDKVIEVVGDPADGDKMAAEGGDGAANATTTFSIQISAVRLGKADVIYDICGDTDATYRSMTTTPAAPCARLSLRYPVVVVRNTGLKDKIYHVVIQLLLGLLNFSFGCELDMAVIWCYMKRPLAPSLGFSSQFLFMPLLGMAITQILKMDDAFGMGLIAVACSPGGGASNSWTLLLGGDINLSLTMTFLSLVLALGMMPLWMYVVSRLYFDSSVIRVPYLQILVTLALFVGPCFVGILLRKARPKWAGHFTALIKPVSVLFLLWVLTFGTYVNLYMFKMMADEPLVVLAGVLLPWCGFGFGFGLALVARQGRRRATAVAIETGIQNIGVPIVLLQRSFPQPDGDLGATVVNSVGLFTPLPLFAALVVITARRRCDADDEVKDAGRREASDVSTALCDVDGAAVDVNDDGGGGDADSPSGAPPGGASPTADDKTLRNAPSEV